MTPLHSTHCWNVALIWRGLDFDIELLDIQQLNDGLFQGRFDFAKCSFHAALRLADETVVVPCGSALGYGVGPLLLSARQGENPGSTISDTDGPVDTTESLRQTTLCPGEHTTAAMLFQMFYPYTTRIEHVVFSEIMPRLREGSADFGVCIHEGRFTWQEQGLDLVEDLGHRWESVYECPLPLGGLVASRRLDDNTIRTFNNVLRDSLEYAREHPDDALTSMRKYAQEFDDDVLQKHVELYVNKWTTDLGVEGSGALSILSKRAKGSRIG